MQNILYKINLLLILCSAIFSAQAQQEALTKVSEKVYVSTNNQTFLAGENLRYTFFNLKTDAQQFSTVSKIGHVELVNTDGEVLKKQSIDLKNAVGNGSIYIPTNTPTGIYKLVAYTRWMLNKPVSALFQADINIINPFQTPKQKWVNGTAQDSVRLHRTQLKPTTSEYLQVSFSKDQYKPREEVTLELSALKNAKLNISVRKLDDLTTTDTINPKSFSEQKFSNKKSNSLEALPEMRGQIIAGHISGPKPAEKSVALSIPGAENSQTSLVNTNKNGEFYFNLEPGKAYQNVYIEVFEEDRKNYSVHLDSLGINYTNINFLQKPFLHASMQKAIEDRSIALQIQNAFFEYKKDSLIKNTISEPFYNAHKKVYVLDEYKRFSTLQETIIEIVNEMYFKQKNNQYSIYLRDRENFSTNEVYGSSLVLFNGVVVQDLNKLFELPAKNIKRIEFVNKGYVFGPRIFNGVVNFINDDFDYELETDKDFRVKTSLNRPLAQRLPNEPDYSNNTLEKIPDYRYQLFWKPVLQLKKENKNLSFFTSDVEGIFEMRIEGFTEEGEPILIKKHFSVVK